jgi:hypothetical protein
MLVPATDDVAKARERDRPGRRTSLTEQPTKPPRSRLQPPRQERRRCIRWMHMCPACTRGWERGIAGGTADIRVARPKRWVPYPIYLQKLCNYVTV